MTGSVDISQADWNKTLLSMSLMGSTGVLVVLLTEEGFFRGWLWAALRIEQTHIYGPEVGLVGLVFNLAFATALWFWISERGLCLTVSRNRSL